MKHYILYSVEWTHNSNGTITATYTDAITAAPEKIVTVRTYQTQAAANRGNGQFNRRMSKAYAAYCLQSIEKQLAIFRNEK